MGRGMFSQPERSGRARWNTSLSVSAAAHLAVLGFLLWQHRPIFISPSYMAAGDWGTATRIVYLAQHGSGAEQGGEAQDAPRIKFPKVRPQPKPRPEEIKADGNTPHDLPGVAPRAGSPYGSLTTGPITGHDWRPALPVAFADPVIRRSEVPPGTEGNVMIEITIDTAGDIISMEVRQKIGYGVEEKVLAALQRWHFRPATMDGVAIASKQYVFFHIPTNS